jgi:carbonic anhydrase/SulP family sulfate permease
MTTPSTPSPPGSTLRADLTAGLVVFLIALPLCLGIALASDAPLFSGLVAGIIGGVLVGLLSGSSTSVSGPAAGLTAVVAAQIASLGSFDTFLLAVVLAGLIQVALGLARAGFVAAFVPSAVITGLLAAIGVILVLKQVPHVVGHDPDPEGEMAFVQPDRETSFSELAQLVNDIHPGAAAIGLLSVAALLLWDRSKRLKRSPLPAPLVVVVLGVGLAELFQRLGGPWAVGAGHLVQVPVAADLAGFVGFLRTPDFGQWNNPAVYLAAATIAAVASLETLLNLEAVDKLDPRQRTSPPSRELLAQGVGNTLSGLAGGLPITAVIVRGSVNIQAGARTRRSAVVHGVLLLVCVALLPGLLNRIPLAALAAVLLVTGVKLASPALVRRMWAGGRTQFVPFAVTVAAIVLTDLLVGVALGLAVSTGFILWSNARRPVRRVVERHLGGDVVHVVLPNHVSFLNRAALGRVLDEVPPGGHVLLDASTTDYIDPDVLDLIREFDERTGPARGVEVSLLGFRHKYRLEDRIQYVDHCTRDLQSALAPAQVLRILKGGNDRFRTGRRLTRDLGRQVSATAAGQHPLAVVLGCIDSRTPAELIFDAGVGDVFVARVAGNVSSPQVLGSIEYACAVAGARLILVMGHTRCGAVTAAVDLAASGRTAAEATGCGHLDPIVGAIQQSIDPAGDGTDREALVNAVARRNVERVTEELVRQSEALAGLVRDGRVAVVGAMYDVATGAVEFLGGTGGAGCDPHEAPGVSGEPAPSGVG